MTLTERYKLFSSEALVQIIESEEGDYTNEAIEAARAELKTRGVTNDDLLSLSRKVIGERIKTYLENFDVINDQLELPKSRILNEEEIKLLFQTVFAHWKSENDDMIPDSWKYVLGAGFG
ncbi:MAG: hypothetical protein R2813_00850 [Flavobacteriales bacterium]